RYLRADPHAFHAWLTLPENWHADMFRMEARNRGVEVVPAAAFAVDPSLSPNAIRICLSHESARQRVRQGLDTLAELLLEAGEGGSMIV
ncbi:MAG: hypothetical protein HOK81_10305, partial [Rhodospirillaceae bacterium]|nr:hypothetical protein [Rhodospirillaceae bacterium]